MPRHPHQKLPNLTRQPRTIGLPTHVAGARVPGFTDEQTAKRDAEALAKVQQLRPLKPPGVKR